MIRFLNKLCLRLEIVLQKKRINIFATIYINFRLLPLSQACLFPIYVYGKVNYVRLQGRCVFQKCKIIRGMVKIGRNHLLLHIAR